jgi:hypothetical protein
MGFRVNQGKPYAARSHASAPRIIWSVTMTITAKVMIIFLFAYPIAFIVNTYVLKTEMLWWEHFLYICGSLCVAMWYS